MAAWPDVAAVSSQSYTAKCPNAVASPQRFVGSAADIAVPGRERWQN